MNTGWDTTAIIGDRDRVVRMPDRCSLPALAAAAACAISKNLSADEINILSAFLCALGDNLAIIAAQLAAGDNC